MSKLFLLIVLLLSGMLCLTGCGGSDDDSSDASSSSAAAPAAQPSATNAPAANPGSVLGAPPADPDDAFRAIVPSGLKLDKKTVLPGGFTSFEVSCNAIAEAVSYRFTTDFGSSVESATPNAELLRDSANADDAFQVTVYAVNANAAATQGLMATVN